MKGAAARPMVGPRVSGWLLAARLMGAGLGSVVSGDVDVAAVALAEDNRV